MSPVVHRNHYGNVSWHKEYFYQLRLRLFLTERVAVERDFTALGFFTLAGLLFEAALFTPRFERDTLALLFPLSPLSAEIPSLPSSVPAEIGRAHV